MKVVTIKNRVFEIFWQVTLALFCVSVFVSKSGLSIFGILLILSSLFLVNWSELFRERGELLAFVGLYPLAIILGFFSLGGAESALKVAISWPWPLLALPAYVVFTRVKDQKVALVSSCVGLIISCAMSFVIFFQEFGGVFGAQVRVRSFWDVSRWGVYLASSLIGLFALMLHFKAKAKENENRSKNKNRTKLMQILIVIVLICLLLANSRAPWLAAAFGGGVFTFLFPRILKFFAILATTVALCLVFSTGLRERVLSVANVQKAADGTVTSTDRSNEGRLYMWKVGAEFFKEQPWFGTGFENTEKYLRDFIDRKPGYREKYVTSEFSFRDQHSSYLTMLVQMGALFCLAFWSIFIYLTWILFKCWWKTRSLYSGAMVALIATHLLIFVFYTSIQSYEMIALFPFMVLVPCCKEVEVK